jgi:hypothetical protein
MNENHFAEIEATLLYVSEARERAEKASKAISKDGAEPHLIDALDAAETELAAVHKRLMQGTYFAVPEGSA